MKLRRRKLNEGEDSVWIEEEKFALRNMNGSFEEHKGGISPDKLFSTRGSLPHLTY